MLIVISAFQKHYILFVASVINILSYQKRVINNFFFLSVSWSSTDSYVSYLHILQVIFSYVSYLHILQVIFSYVSYLHILQVIFSYVSYLLLM